MDNNGQALWDDLKDGRFNPPLPVNGEDEPSLSELYEMVKAVTRQGGGKVHECLGAVMRAIRPIGKDRQNVQQKFRFRGIDDIYNALHDLLAEHNIITLPHVVSCEYADRKTKADALQVHVRMVIDYEFYCTLDGSSKRARIHSEALDTSDKATNKALSFAHKYCLLQVFAIPTESYEDVDERGGEYGVAEGDRETIRAGSAQGPAVTSASRPVRNIPALLAAFNALGVDEKAIETKIRGPINAMRDDHYEWLRKTYSHITVDGMPKEKFFPAPATSAVDELNERFGTTT